MPKRSTVWGAVATVTLAAGVPLSVIASSDPASAVTGGCANSPRPVSGPVGCGAFFLPQVGYARAKTVLTLTAAGTSFGSRVEVEPMTGSPRQDWTAYLVCDGLTTGNRSAAAPCGSGKVVPNEVVLRYSPGGAEPSGGVNSFQSLCLDDWAGRAALAWCQSGQAFYVEGFTDPPVTNGAAPAVSRPNPAETWKLAKSGKSVVLVNVYSGRALDDAGNGGPSSKLITYAPNGLADQEWQSSGCTSPFDVMPGRYGCING